MYVYVTCSACIFHICIHFMVLVCCTQVMRICHPRQLHMSQFWVHIWGNSGFRVPSYTKKDFEIDCKFLAIDCCAKFATGLKCSNRHRSKSMRVSKLFFCQIDPPMSASFWQKNRLDTQILFDLCLFEHFSPVANFAQQSIVTQPFVKFFCIGPIHFAKRLGKTEHIVYKFSW